MNVGGGGARSEHVVTAAWALGEAKRAAGSLRLLVDDEAVLDEEEEKDAEGRVGVAVVALAVVVSAEVMVVERARVSTH